MLKRYYLSLRRQRRPLRFLAANLLWLSRACRFFVIDRGSYRLRFYPTSLSREYWLDRSERVEDESIIIALVSPGDVVVDVGANVGAITLAASRAVGEAGRVHAFEPHPRTFKYLQGNLELNQAVNVMAHNVALGEDDGTVIFSSRRSDDQNYVVQSADGIPVEARRLDDVLRDEPRIALLKVDVEGYELAVLKGAAEALRRSDSVFFEAWEDLAKRYGYSTPEINAYLQNLGFRLFRQHEGVFSEIPAQRVSWGCDNLLGVRNLADFTRQAEAVGWRVETLTPAENPASRNMESS